MSGINQQGNLIASDLNDNVKKNLIQSDDQDNENQRKGQPKNPNFLRSQSSQKVPSQHFTEYLNFFDLPRGYRIEPPVVSEQTLESFRRNYIRYSPQYFSSKPKIKFKKTSPIYSVINLDVFIGYFMVSLKILNMQQQIPKRTDDAGNQLSSEIKGNFGQILLLDWEQFLNSKYVIQLQQLKYLQKSQPFSSTFSAQHKYATKIFYFPIKKFSPLDRNQYKYEKIYEFIIQYAICKIASCLKIGLNIQHPFGFDLICYKDSIQFIMEKGESISHNLSKNFQNVTKCLKSSLLLLHSLQIVHRDIKYDNFLYSPSYKKIVFIDFGLSEIIYENIGEKSKTIYKGSYFFLSEEAKRLMFDVNNFTVDLYWNDVIGLVRTINMLRNIRENNSQEAEYQDSFRERTINCGLAKDERIHAMKHYLKIQTFYAISRKFVCLNLKVIAKLQKSQQLQFIQKWLQFIEGLESCPIYDQFKSMLKKELGLHSTFFPNRLQNNECMYLSQNKDQFFKRYINSPQQIQLQMTFYDDSWKKPLEKLCLEYLKTRKRGTQFSILTYIASTLFQNINTNAYIFKKLFSVFQQKLIKYFQQSPKNNTNSFLFRDISKQSIQDIQQQYQQSQKHMIVQNYLIQINRHSAVLLTNYVEVEILSFYRFQKNTLGKFEFHAQLVNPKIQKCFYIKQEVQEIHLLPWLNFTKILFIIYKIYVKQYSYYEQKRMLQQKIKIYCSKYVYLKTIISFLNSNILRLSNQVFNKKLQQAQMIFQTIKQQDDSILMSQFSSQKSSFNKTKQRKIQRQNVRTIQFQIFMVKLNYDTFNRVSSRNAFQLKQKLKNAYQELLRIKYKIQNHRFDQKYLNILNLEIVCNVFLGNQIHNKQLIQRYHDIISFLYLQKDVFYVLQLSYLHLSSGLGCKTGKKSHKFQPIRSKFDPNSFLIIFQDQKYQNKYSFNAFITSIRVDCNSNNQNTINKFQQAIEGIHRMQIWDQQSQQQFRIRRIKQYLNYLSYSYTAGFQGHFDSLKFIVIKEYKHIRQRYQTELGQNISILRISQNIIEAFLDLQSQVEILSIAQLLDGFIEIVQASGGAQSQWPQMFWIVKAMRTRQMNVGLAQDQLVNGLEQAYYEKMIQYQPIHNNFFTFCSVVLLIDKRLQADNQILSQNIKEFIQLTINHILTNQATDYIMKHQKLLTQLFKYLIQNKKIKVLVCLLLVICKYLNTYKSSMNRKVLHRISTKIFSHNFVTYTEEILSQLDQEICCGIRLPDRRLNYGVAEISVFWLAMLLQEKSAFQWQKLRRISLFFVALSHQSRQYVYKFYFKIGSNQFRKQGKLKLAKKFLRYDLRSNGYLNKQLYLKFLFNSSEYSFLQENLTQDKQRKNRYDRSSQNIGIFKFKILTKVLKLKKLHK